MVNYVRRDILGELLYLVEKRRKEALHRGDLEGYTDWSRIRKLLLTGGGILRRDSGYHNFMSQCMRGRGAGKSYADTLQAMVDCAEKWRKLSFKEKMKYSDGYEMINLP